MNWYKTIKLSGISLPEGITRGDVFEYIQTMYWASTLPEYKEKLRLLVENNPNLRKVIVDQNIMQYIKGVCDKSRPDLERDLKHIKAPLGYLGTTKPQSKSPLTFPESN